MLLAVTAHVGFRSAQPDPPPPPRELVVVEWPKPLTRELPKPSVEPTTAEPAEPPGTARSDGPNQTAPPPASAAAEPSPPQPLLPEPAPPGPELPAPQQPEGTTAPATGPTMSQPPQPREAPPATSTPRLSAAARVELACNREIYASTEVAAFRVEEERLSRTPEEWRAEVESRLIDPTAAALTKSGQPELAKIARITLGADWAGAVDWLDRTRPPLAIRVLGVPAGSEIEVSLAVAAPALRAMVMGPHGTVTRRIVLDPATPGVIGLSSPDCWQVAVDPAWNREFLGSLLRRLDVDIAIDVSFPADGSHEPTLWHRVTVYPVSDVQIRYPSFIGAFAHVDPGHPFLDRMASAITQSDLARRMRLQLGAMGDWREAYAWFRAFHALGIRYESSAMAAPRKRQDDPIQRIRPIHKSLRERSANCADMSVLMASALSRSMETFVMLPPGHAFVAFADPTLGRLVGIEVTYVGRDEDSEAAGRAAQASGMLNSGTPFRDFRDLLPGPEVPVFDLFLMAMIAGTQQIEAAVAHAQATGALAALEARRVQLEAQAAAASDPDAARALREQAAQLAVEASWRYMKPILVPAAVQLGAEHAEPDADTLKRHETRIDP